MRLSHSKINTLARCPRKYHLQYNRKIKPRVKPKYFTDGNLMSRLLELYHANCEHEMSISELQAIAQDKDDFHTFWVYAAYRQWLEQEWQETSSPIFSITEHKFAIQITDYLTYSGIIDLVELGADGTIWIWDHKFSNKYYMRSFGPAEMSPQLVGYAYYLRSLGHDKINVGWNILIKDDDKAISAGDLRKVFKRKWSEVTDIQLEEWQSDVEYWAVKANGFMPRNLSTCRSYPGQGRCPFIQLCENGINEVTMLDFTEG